MTRIGYPLMTEQSGPRDLVRYAERAEAAGFDVEVCSDHPAGKELLARLHAESRPVDGPA